MTFKVSQKPRRGQNRPKSKNLPFQWLSRHLKSHGKGRTSQNQRICPSNGLQGITRTIERAYKSAEQDSNLQRPKATDLQSACFPICISADLSAVRGTRTPSPLPRIAGFQDRSGTIAASQRSTRSGIRTRTSFRTHGSEPCLYNQFHAPGHISTGEGSRTLRTPLLRRVRIPFRHSCVSVSGGT